MKRIFLLLSFVLLCLLVGCSNETGVIKSIILPTDGIISKAEFESAKNSQSVLYIKGSDSVYEYQWAVFGTRITETNDTDMTVSVSQMNENEYSVNLSESLPYSASLSIRFPNAIITESVLILDSEKNELCSASISPYTDYTDICFYSNPEIAEYRVVFNTNDADNIETVKNGSDGYSDYLRPINNGTELKSTDEQSEEYENAIVANTDWLSPVNDETELKSSTKASERKPNEKNKESDVNKTENSDYLNPIKSDDTLQSSQSVIKNTEKSVNDNDEYEKTDYLNPLATENKLKSSKSDSENSMQINTEKNEKSDYLNPINSDGMLKSSEKNTVNISDGTYTGQDEYLTDPVPKGKQLPVDNPEIDKNTAYSCTISISCSTILNNMDLCDPEKRELVPSDGWILKPTTVTFNEGESVFDVLQRVCRENGIHMEFEFTPMYNSAYIEGINNLYEFDVGNLSGWMFSVNGWFPNYGCSRYILQDGDTVSWCYTCDLGYDVGGGYAVGG